MDRGRENEHSGTSNINHIINIITILIILTIATLFMIRMSLWHCFVFNVSVLSVFQVRSISFASDTHLVSAGLDADVYLWDIRNTARCVHRFAAIHCDAMKPFDIYPTTDAFE